MNRKLINRNKTIVEILDIARAQIDSDNFDILNLREIAKDLGVSAPAVLHYFSTKDDLIARLLTEGFSEFFQFNLNNIVENKDKSAEELISIYFKSSGQWTADNNKFALWMVNNQLMSNNFQKYKDYDSFSELKKVSKYNTLLLASLIQLVIDDEKLNIDNLSPDNLEKILQNSQAIYLAGKHGLPLIIYNLFKELGPGKINKGLVDIIFEKYLNELTDSLISDAIKSKNITN